MYTCFLFGQLDAADSLQEVLDHEVENHITNLGVKRFVVGHSGNFDRMALKAVQNAKRKHPDIYAFLFVPCLSDTVNIPIPEGFDDIYFPTGLLGLPRRFAIPKANRLIICESNFVIAYVRQENSNYGKLLRHACTRMAKGRLLQIVNLSNSLE